MTYNNAARSSLLIRNYSIFQAGRTSYSAHNTDIVKIGPKLISPYIGHLARTVFIHVMEVLKQLISTYQHSEELSKRRTYNLKITIISTLTIITNETKTRPDEEMTSAIYNYALDTAIDLRAGINIQFYTVLSNQYNHYIHHHAGDPAYFSTYKLYQDERFTNNRPSVPDAAWTLRVWYRGSETGVKSHMTLMRNVLVRLLFE